VRARVQARCRVLGRLLHESLPDGKTYLIAYYDCCGAPGCSTTYCGEPDAQAVMYNPVAGSFDQEIIWCISDESQSYTCTLSPIVGEDCQTQKATRPRVGAGSR
jgi:methylamine dehydrogenase light chain